MNNILIKLVSFTLIVLRCSSKSKIATQSPADIRNDIVLLHHNGQYNDLIHYLEAIEKESRFNYSLVIDNKQPSLYSYRGVALASHVFRDKIGAVKAFENATFYFPNDTRSWINLGNLHIICPIINHPIFKMSEPSMNFKSSTNQCFKLY